MALIHSLFTHHNKRTRNHQCKLQDKTSREFWKNNEGVLLEKEKDMGHMGDKQSVPRKNVTVCVSVGKGERMEARSCLIKNEGLSTRSRIWFTHLIQTCICAAEGSEWVHTMCWHLLSWFNTEERVFLSGIQSFPRSFLVFGFFYKVSLQTFLKSLESFVRLLCTFKIARQSRWLIPQVNISITSRFCVCARNSNGSPNRLRRLTTVPLNGCCFYSIIFFLHFSTFE